MATDVVEVNAITGEVVERAFTAAEKAQHKRDEDATALTRKQELADMEAQSASRDSAIAKFSALGFTADEIASGVLPDVSVSKVDSVLLAHRIK
jgi:hypothetical protein